MMAAMVSIASDDQAIGGGQPGTGSSNYGVQAEQPGGFIGKLPGELAVVPSNPPIFFLRIGNSSPASRVRCIALFCHSG